MGTRADIAAISGIDAEQAYLDEAGANIANTNTVGYKQGDVVFSDLLAEQMAGASAPTAGSGGVDPVAIGSGVRVSAVALDPSEGTLESTGISTDAAITGSGYFVVEDGGQQLYTRDGAFTVDADGGLTTLTGGEVLGWEANSAGTVTTNTQPQAITIPTGQTIPAVSTSTVNVSGNLPAWGGGATTVPTYTLTVDTYNSLGDVVPVSLTFTGTATANTWKLTAVAKTPVKGTTVKLFTTGTDAPTIEFSANGEIEKIDGKTASATALTLAATTKPTGITNLSIHFPLASSAQGLTQYAGQETVALTQNGHAAGTLVSYSIGSNGVITGTFSNGESQSIAQIAMASFANSSGLEELGNNMFSVSANSGAPSIGAPGTGSRGSLVGGELELSNVTLAVQLTDLTTAEEAYVANTKVVATTQEAQNALMQA